MPVLQSIRNRSLFIAAIALLLAVWIMKSALHLAGAALRFIVIIAAVVFAISWITTKVGQGR